MQRPALRPPALTVSGAVCGAALALVLLAGCSGDGPAPGPAPAGPAPAGPAPAGPAPGPVPAAPAAGVTRIVAKSSAFTPAAVSVPAGTTITWSFEDGPVPHDVKGGGMDSGGPRSNGTFTHRFDQPGSYDYRCSLHPGMTGRVEVR